MSYFLLLLAFLMLTKISIFDLLIDFVNLPQYNNRYFIETNLL